MYPVLQSILEQFSSLHKESLGALASTPPCGAQHYKPYFPSPWIHLFWAFRVKWSHSPHGLGNCLLSRTFRTFSLFPQGQPLRQAWSRLGITSQCPLNLAPQEKEGRQGNQSFPQEQSEKVRSHHFMANRWGNSGNSGRLYFGGLQMVTAAMKLKDTYSLEGKL